MKPELTIGMAVYDDLDGVYFTVQSINAYHKEVRDRVEIIVLDNNPGGKHSGDIKDFMKWVPNGKYLPYGDWNSTAVRDVLFDVASSDYVLCVDSHVQLMPHSIERLIDFYNQNPYCPNLIQGPIIFDDLESYATNFNHEWRNNMLGVWGKDDRGSDPMGHPFEIDMQGLGVFSCRRINGLGLIGFSVGSVAKNGIFTRSIGRLGLLHCVYRLLDGIIDLDVRVVRCIIWR